MMTEPAPVIIFWSLFAFSHAPHSVILGILSISPAPELRLHTSTFHSTQETLQWSLHSYLELASSSPNATVKTISTAVTSSSPFIGLWAQCTVFRHPLPHWRESSSMEASSRVPQGTHEWRPIEWLGVCEMQCIFENHWHHWTRIVSWTFYDIK